MQVKNIFKCLECFKIFKTPYKQYYFDIYIYKKWLFVNFRLPITKLFINRLNLIAFVFIICLNVSNSNLIVQNFVKNSTTTENFASILSFFILISPNTATLANKTRILDPKLHRIKISLRQKF